MTLPDAREKQRFVERMFDGIAPRYDLMNRLMTLGIDRAWRRAAISALQIRGGERVVDIGCGTGDLCAEASAAGAHVIGADLSAGMLRLAAKRLRDCQFVRCDAQAIPLADTSCDGVVSGFAVRNFASVRDVMRECGRILRPGGRISLLEVDVPTTTAARLAFDVYFGRVVPLLGRIVSKGYAYEYLSDSLVYLPSHEDLRAMLFASGFEGVTKQRVTMGAGQLVTAVRV